MFVIPDRTIPRKKQETRKMLDGVPEVSFVDWYALLIKRTLKLHYGCCMALQRLQDSDK